MFRAGLRVNGVQAAPGLFAMTWAPDSRATFSYRPGSKPANRTPPGAGSARTTPSRNPEPPASYEQQ